MKNKNLFLIAATALASSIDPDLSVIEKYRYAFRKLIMERDEVAWPVQYPSDEDLFRIGVGATYLAANEEQREQIERGVTFQGRWAAVTDGHRVTPEELSGIFDGIKPDDPVPQLIWEQVKESLRV